MSFVKSAFLPLWSRRICGCFANKFSALCKANASHLNQFKFLNVSFCLNESENRLHYALVVETRVKFNIGLRTDRIFKRWALIHLQTQFRGLGTQIRWQLDRKDLCMWDEEISTGQFLTIFLTERHDANTIGDCRNTKLDDVISCNKLLSLQNFVSDAEALRCDQHWYLFIRLRTWCDFQIVRYLSYLGRAPVTGANWEVWYKYWFLFVVNSKRKR